MKKTMVIIYILCLIITISGVCAETVTIPTFSLLNNEINQISDNSNLSDNSNNMATMQISSTPDSKKPVIRYPNPSLPQEIRNTIEYIDFQKDTSKNGQTFIYFNMPVETATVDQSKNIAKFIMSRDEWLGDRSLDSVSAEIYIHWVADNAEPLFQNNSFSQGLWKELIIGENDDRPSPVYPTHLGYKYAGLDKTNPMDSFLLTL